jgi:Domain of unknown function (DUF1877)
MGMVLYVRRLAEEAIPEDPDEFDEFFFDEDAEAAGDLIDFDKAWHALHFLLTGSADGTDSPLSLLLGKGEPVGEDGGYGPPLMVPAAGMRRFHEALAALSDEDLRRRYDPQAMLAADVYLADSLADEEDGWDYVAQGIPALRRLAERCVQQNSGAIIFIS